MKENSDVPLLDDLKLKKCETSIAERPLKNIMPNSKIGDNLLLKNGLQSTSTVEVDDYLVDTNSIAFRLGSNRFGGPSIPSRN